MSKTNNVSPKTLDTLKIQGVKALKNGYKLALKKHPKLLIFSVGGAATLACGWSIYALYLNFTEDSY